MLKTYAVVTGVRPDDAKAVVETTLTEEGVTDFEVTLLSAVANGFTLQIDASETRTNAQRLTRLYGEANLTASTEENKQDARKRLEEKLQALPAFDASGKEGRFAREHTERG